MSVVVRLIGKSACSARRSLSALALAAALLALPLFAVGSTSAATTGLVAAYSFNEGSGTTVGDASGNGNVGTTSNTTWSASGKYGGALSFNGTSARVNIPNSASLQLTTAMTLEAWVNPSDRVERLARCHLQGQRQLLPRRDVRPRRQARWWRDVRGGSYADAFGTSRAGCDTWSYLAVTYDGSTLRLYVNGTQVGSQARTGAITTSTSQLQIGGDSLYGQYFKGLIDEVRVYNIALSAAAIQTDMTTPVSGSSTTDTTPPSTPTALTTSAVGQTSLTLSWNPSSDNTAVTGYRTYLNGTQVGTSPTTSYGYGSLSCGINYTLGVAAVDAAGNVSGIATLAKQTAACSDTTPPSTPTALTTSAVGQTSLTLSWNPSSDNTAVTGYRTYLNGTQVGTSPTTSYGYGSLSCGTNYTLGVAAVDAAGNVSGIATLAKQTAACSDTTPPSTPTALTTSAVGQTSLTLSWNPSSDNTAVTGYRTYLNGTQVGTSADHQLRLRQPQLRNQLHARCRCRRCGRKRLGHRHPCETNRCLLRHDVTLSSRHPDRHRRNKHRDRPFLGSRHRQCRCHRLPNLALSRRRLHQLHPTHPDHRLSDHLQRSQPSPGNHLQLSSPRS